MQQAQIDRLLRQVEALVAIVDLLERRLSKLEATPYWRQHGETIPAPGPDWNKVTCSGDKIPLPVPGSDTTLHLPKKKHEQH